MQLYIKITPPLFLNINFKTLQCIGQLYFIMNIFNSLRQYATPWTVKETRDFTADEINAVSSTVVVASQYGNSLCFHMKAGGMCYIPMSNDSTKGIGESVDLHSAKLITLEKSGEEDIVRVKA